MFEKLTDNIYMHKCEFYTDRPNIGLIVGEKHSLLFEAGNSVYHVENLKKEIEEQGLKFPSYVALSHWHWDHSFGAAAWEIPVIAGKMTNEKLREVSLWKWDDESMKERLENGQDILFCYEMVRREYPDRSVINVIPADIIFGERLILDLGGITAELIHAGGPHSPDSVICYVPSERIVFLGDGNSKNLLNNKWHFDIEHEELLDDEIDKIPFDPVKVEEFISVLDTLDADIFIGGHTPPKSREVLYKELRG